MTIIRFGCLAMLLLAGCKRDVPLSQITAPEPAIATHRLRDLTDLRKAFLHHQEHELPDVKKYYPQEGGESFVLQERWKNYQKYTKECPAIAEVVSVEVNKTVDGGDYVITMRGPNAGKDGPDGFELDTCSLWVNGAKENTRLEVRDFTNY